MIMLCEDEEEFDLFGDEEKQLLTDEDILLMLLDDCNRKSDPIHLQYPRFAMTSFSEEEFVTQFHFKRPDMPALMHSLRLKDNYMGSNGIKWTGEEGLCILLRRLCYPNRLADLVPLFG